MVFQLVIVNHHSIITPPYPVYLKSQKPPAELSDEFGCVFSSSVRDAATEHQATEKDRNVTKTCTHTLITAKSRV